MVNSPMVNVFSLPVAGIFRPGPERSAARPLTAVRAGRLAEAGDTFTRLHFGDQQAASGLAEQLWAMLPVLSETKGGTNRQAVLRKMANPFRGMTSGQVRRMLEREGFREVGRETNKFDSFEFVKDGNRLIVVIHTAPPLEEHSTVRGPHVDCVFKQVKRRKKSKDNRKIRLPIRGGAYLKGKS